MQFSLVAAASTNNAIGKNNQLLWHLPNDLRFFKNITWGLPVLMGRKTFEALNRKPLKGRLNILLTQQAHLQSSGFHVAHSISQAIDIAQYHAYKQIMVIGGGEVYQQFFSFAQTIYLTRVHAVFEEADTFFPEIKETEWSLMYEYKMPADEKHEYACSFQCWKKNNFPLTK
jgi:dihydrofolate reductase